MIKRICSAAFVATPLLVSAIWTQSAQAQTTGNQPAADSSSTDALPDIVVTAQRREERLQSVPIAISAITADDVRERGVNDTESLTTVVSGLNFTQFSTQATPYIRGIGSNIISQGDENSVAIYVDGILQQTPNTAIFSLANVDRIEVLKGPQGTLFGRNANGGVINVTTRKPTRDTVAEATVGYGNLQTTDGRFYGSTGVGEQLATDLSVYYHNQGEGYGRDLYNNTDIFRSRDLSIRNKWIWAPSDATSITLAAAYSRASDDAICTHLIPGELGADGVTAYSGFYTYDGNTFCRDERHGYDGSLTINQDVGFADFVSLTGYSWLKSKRPGDSDYTPANIEDAPILNQFDSGWTQELQLQSKRESAIKWIVGFYYLNTKSGYTPPDGITVTGSSLGGLPYFRIVGQQSAKSPAGFAQSTATIFSGTRLTLGVRYTSDKRSIDGVNEIPGLIIANGNTSKTFNKFTYKVTLDHDITDNVLVYATNSTGFKAGVYNLPSPSAPPAEPESLRAYELGVKSTLLDHRVQLNAAAYRYNYTNIQAVAATGTTGFTSLINAAKARVTGADLDFDALLVRGFKIQGGVSYVDAKYTSFPGAPENIPAPGGGAQSIIIDASGNRMVKAPKLQFNIGPQLDIPTGLGHMVFAANYSHQSAFYWNFSNTFREPPRDLVSASLAWSPSDAYEVRFWGKNLLDKQYSNSGLDTPFGAVEFPGLPRTYGVSVTAKLR